MPKISALPQETEITSNDKIAFVDSDATPQRTHYITLADFVASVFGTGTASGWNTLNAGVAPTVSTGYNKGNKEYDLTFSNVNLTTSLSPGMRMKLDRTGTVPTRCSDLEASSSQYWVKTTPSGLAQTDDITVEAWVKLESYGAMAVVSKRTSSANGWDFLINASGQLRIHGLIDGSNYKLYQTYQAIPLGEWTHIAASMNMSANSAAIYFNGASVPIATTAVGTANSLTNATTVYVGSDFGNNYLDGKVTDVRIWSVVRTATEIRDNMNQQLTGSETNLVAYWKLSGDGNDSTSNANNLTANGSANATATDNPQNTTEYAIITNVSYSAPNSTVTVFTGTDYNIPNLTMENPYYSTHKTPYGFPAVEGKWQTTYLLRANVTLSSSTSYANLTGISFPINKGLWSFSYAASVYVDRGTNDIYAYFTVSTSTTAESNIKLTTRYGNTGSVASTIFHVSDASREALIENSSQTTYYAIIKATAASGSSGVVAAENSAYFTARCAYL